MSEDQPLWDDRFPCDNQLCRTSFGKLHGLIDDQKLEIIKLKKRVEHADRLLDLSIEYAEDIERKFMKEKNHE